VMTIDHSWQSRLPSSNRSMPWSSAAHCGFLVEERGSAFA